MLHHSAHAGLLPMVRLQVPAQHTAHQGLALRSTELSAIDESTAH